MRNIVFILIALCQSIAVAQPIEGKRAPGEIIATAEPEQWRNVDPAQLMIIDLELRTGPGRVTIELSENFAPNHVAQLKTLVKAGFYDRLSFYRVIDGFVAQAGDPFGTRALPEGTVKNITAENTAQLIDIFDLPGLVPDHYAEKVFFLDAMPMGRNDREAWPLHCTGALAIGRENDPDTASTEIYVTLQPQRYLDRNLTIVGRVIGGMEHVQALTRQLPPENEGDPLGDVIVRAWMGDVPPEGESTPQWQVFETGTALFSEYVASRRNRPEAFFIYRPDHVDICQLTIPVRQKPDLAEKTSVDE